MRRPDRKDETTHRTHRRDEERDDIEGTSKSVVDKEHQAHERKKTSNHHIYRPTPSPPALSNLRASNKSPAPGRGTSRRRQHRSAGAVSTSSLIA